MRDNPEGGELNLAEVVRRRCKKNFSSVLFCIGKRTRKGCDRSSVVETSSQRTRWGRASSSSHCSNRQISVIWGRGVMDKYPYTFYSGWKSLIHSSSCSIYGIFGSERVGWKRHMEGGVDWKHQNTVKWRRGLKLLKNRHIFERSLNKMSFIPWNLMSLQD